MVSQIPLPQLFVCHVCKTCASAAESEWLLRQSHFDITKTKKRISEENKELHSVYIERCCFRHERKGTFFKKGLLSEIIMPPNGRLLNQLNIGVEVCK